MYNEHDSNILRWEIICNDHIKAHKLQYIVIILLPFFDSLIKLINLCIYQF